MIKKAMILAAGLGTRMRPLTNQCPKPLIKVDGIALIDHKLEAARRAGIKTVVVNVHYLADQLESHLRHCENPRIVISDERDQLMDSGGGISAALSHFGSDPFLVMNSDTFWIADKSPNLLQLLDFWRDGDMDILLSLASKSQAVGFNGVGDFFIDDNHRLVRRGNATCAPYAFAGDYIVHPRIFANRPQVPFSSNILFNQAIDKGRLWGLQLSGTWLHVGTPAAIAQAEQAIAHNRAR